MTVKKNYKILIMALLLIVATSCLLLTCGIQYSASAISSDNIVNDSTRRTQKVYFNYKVSSSEANIYNENNTHVANEGQALKLYNVYIDAINLPKYSTLQVEVNSSNYYKDNLPNHFYTTNGYIGLN
ncbi:MAG: hypothetical protein OSJ68_01735, partial [Clostridia bacterium]|nr:hypothetical protein [Clostridia bacterium]